MKVRDWAISMDEDNMEHLMNALSKAYSDTYSVTKDDWGDMIEAAEAKPRYDHAGMLRDVMHELHKQGEGLDTLLALKNDQLREWWNTELAKIKRAEAKAAAREKAKSLFSEEERKLLGMRF